MRPIQIATQRGRQASIPRATIASRRGPNWLFAFVVAAMLGGAGLVWVARHDLHVAVLTDGDDGIGVEHRVIDLGMPTVAQLGSTDAVINRTARVVVLVHKIYPAGGPALDAERIQIAPAMLPTCMSIISARPIGRRIGFAINCTVRACG